MDEMTDKELEELARDRDEAEKAGLFDNDVYDTIENPSKALHLTEDQEYDLWMATSALSRLAKETNSSMSELLKIGQR